MQFDMCKGKRNGREAKGAVVGGGGGREEREIVGREGGSTCSSICVRASEMDEKQKGGGRERERGEREGGEREGE